MLPFLIRARQCLICARNAKDSTERVLHFTNTAKYCTAFPVITFATLYAMSGSETGFQDHFEVFWGFSAVVNATFSFLWDLVMDWGLLHVPQRPRCDPERCEAKQYYTLGLREVLAFRRYVCAYHLV